MATDIGLKKIPLTLAALLWSTGLTAQGVGQPELILTNGKILTLSGNETIAEAVAVTSGRISAVGSSRDLRKLAGSDTEIIDLEGRTVIPGLIDSHSHFLRAARHYSASVDIGEAKSVADALAVIAASAKESAPGEWIVVHGGWHSNQFAERRAPLPAELDEAAPRNPVFLLQGYELLLLNTPALAKLGITSADSLPAPMKVALDDQGKPTGVIVTTGNSMKVNQLLASIRSSDEENAVRNTRAFMQALGRSGLTGFIDDGGLSGPDQYEAVKTLWRTGELPIRVRYNIFSLKAGEEIDDVEASLAAIRAPREDDWLRLMGLGELMTAGMYISSSATDPQPPSATVKKNATDYGIWAAKRGYTLDVHAPTDMAASAVLDVYEAVNSEVDIRPLRWRISHCESCSDETLSRMASLGVSLLAQNALYFDTDDFTKRSAREAVRRAPPIMSAARAGIKVGAGSDATVVSPYNPFVGIRWLINGKTLTGEATRGAEELAPRLDALRMYTINNAWMSFEEDSRGSIEAGKLADLVILDRDFLSVPVDDIGAIKPVATIVGGKFIYEDTAALRRSGRK